MPAGRVYVRACNIPPLCVFCYGVKARAFGWDNSMSRWGTKSERFFVSQLILKRKRPHKLCKRRREFMALLFYYCVYYYYCYFVLFLCRVFTSICGPGGSVGIATDCGLDGSGSNPGGDEIFRPSRSVLGPNQPPVKWVLGLSRG